MTKLTTIMTNRWSFRRIFRDIRRRRQFKSRMHKFTAGTVRTKTSEIIFTQNSSHMTMTTRGAMTTKSSIVPGAVFDLRFWIDVEESALFFMACIKSRIEVALGHFCHVIFVQKFAAVALLTESSQPMLANDCFLLEIYMTKWTKFFIAFS